MLKLSGISDEEIDKIMSRLKRFLEACSYQIDDDRIIIYINELKQQFEPETVKKHIITIKRFLRFVNYPNVDMIKLPKIPKRRGVSIRPEHIKQIAEKAYIHLAFPARKLYHLFRLSCGVA